MIRDTIDDIQEACPDVNPETLLADVPVVTESAIELRDVFFDRGFGNSEAYEATMYGWKQLRITQLKPSAALTPKQLISLVSGFGKLVIKSSPYGALIVIDGKILPDKTEHVRWETPGTYRLKLTLDGYESHEDQCVVEEGKATYFVKSLNPIKPPKARQKRPRKP
ncbi:MAG TPA: PEGA domain-containing protein [Pyrinomonadaceae bacterium]|nr:PEGA domain-containing protein [Pyrinomonadaceae bacterium]